MNKKQRGYTGVVHFDDEAMIFYGEVVGLSDVVTFRGTTPEEIKKEFEASVDGYISWCRELGQDPEKPFLGNIHLRLTADLHAKLTTDAKLQAELAELKSQLARYQEKFSR